MQILSAMCALGWFGVAIPLADMASSRSSFLFGVAARVHALLPFLCFFLRYYQRPWAHRTLLSACWVFAGAVIAFISTIVVLAVTAEAGHGAILGIVCPIAALIVALDGLRLYGLIQLIGRLRRPEGRALFGLPPRPKEF